jgi:kynurenine formamidase
VPNRHVDLSHAIEDGMVTVPFLPPPRIDEHLTREASRERYAPGTEFSIGRITMVANTGTYVDTPFHRYADGEDLAAVDLARLVDLEAVVVDATNREDNAIGPDIFSGMYLRGLAVLVHTGWDAHWGTERYGSGHPFLTRECAERLVDEGAALVGIDSQNIDSTDDPTRPAHTLLLGAGIPIVEHLTRLGELPPTGFRFTAAPPRVVGMGTWPVRAFATITTAE